MSIAHVKMKPPIFGLLLRDSKYKRSYPCFLVLLIVSIYIVLQCKEKFLKWNSVENLQNLQDSSLTTCENQCRPPGSKPLPQGFVVKTSNLETRPLWGSPKTQNTSRSLFTLAVGLKQKKTVDKMVRKFLESNFVVMLFHYDGVVDGWKDLGWNDNVIHISALNQTKWWFAKRFLHPDIVADYEYVFLWDEDIGVENFEPKRYLSIVKDEELEISQPALDVSKSEVHHQITARGRSSVHRRMYKPGGKGTRCNDESSAPPCTGLLWRYLKNDLFCSWIEVMAPVFSRTAWSCVWHMIQNDLIHAWGLDLYLGYCAQGDRTQKIGVVDAEYIVHYGLPTLGEPESKETSHHKAISYRAEVRRQSFREYRVFRSRWSKAVEEDQCWTDPYKEPIKEITL